VTVELKKQNIIIIIPTYNEAENIANLINEVFSLNLNPSVLIIDDNSPDRTRQEVEKLMDRYPSLYLITRKKKLGLASAYKEGFKFALEKRYDVIIQMDADLSHSPSYILEMLNLLSKYDMVIGSRYIKEGGTLNWWWGRVLLSRLANIFAKTLLRIPINDLTSGFKCIRRSALENIDFRKINSRGYSFQIEIVFYTFSKDFKVIEYPIIFKGRRKEKSKMSLDIGIEAFFKVLFLSFPKLNSTFNRQI
jgi:dolichol-phosphate mannosyltransferase